MNEKADPGITGSAYRWDFMTEILNGLLNLPGLNAGGTNPHAPYAAIVVDTNALQVGVPAPFGHIVCVALVMPDHGPLATNIAFF